MDEWILCSERLPEKGVCVWVTIAGSDLIFPKDGETFSECIKRQHREIRRVEVGILEDDGWYDLSGFPSVVRPIAWMEYKPPKPYVGDIHFSTPEEAKAFDEAMESFWHEKDLFDPEPFDE